jgi:tricorn protease
MKGKAPIALIAAIGLLSSLGLCDSIKRARHPAISPDLSTIAFTYQGDIWTAPAEGGLATRVTVHEAREVSPIFSPDGKTLIFSSDRYGNPDVFAVPVGGGNPKQITIHSSYDYGEAFTPDGEWLWFRSGRMGGADLYRVRLSGGTPIQMTSDPYVDEYFPTFSPDGKKVALCIMGSPGGWRRHNFEGSGAADIWVADNTTPLTNFRRITDSPENDFAPKWHPTENMIYFISGESGTPNIWKMKPDGTGKVQVTNHTYDGVRIPSMSLDGAKIVYEFDSRIWILDTQTGDDHPVDIQAPSEFKENLRERKTYKDNVDEYEVSPDDKKVAFVVRGDVYVGARDGGKEAKQITATPWREEAVVWNPDSDKLAYVSDRSGSKDIFVYDIVAGQETPLAGGPDDETSPRWSPDGKWIAYHEGSKSIMRIPAPGGEPELVAEGDFYYKPLSSSASFRWSPDSKWMSYTEPTPAYHTDIYLVGLDKHEPHKILHMGRNASPPEWSGDCKFIFFSCSEYGNSEVYALDLEPKELKFDEDEFDKLFEKKPEEKPKGDGGDEGKDGVKKDSDAPKGDAEKEQQGDGKDDKGKEEKKDSKPQVKIDFQDLDKRLRRVTRLDSEEYDIVASADGKTLYFVSTLNDSRNIWSVSSDSTEATRLTQITTDASPGGLSMSADGKSIYFTSGGALKSVGTADKKVSTISTSATKEIDFLAENQQVFNEAWWVLDRAFYDPEFHGRDWEAIKARYQAMLPWTPVKDDFYELMYEMIMEVDASHMGISRSGDYSVPDPASTALLGVEFDPGVLANEGLFKIKSVVPQSPADDPHSKLNAGEYIIQIDDTPLSGDTNFYSALSHKEGKKVRLLVNNEPSPENAREVFLKPVGQSAWSRLRYDAWVEGSRKRTHEFSGDRLGYIHIRSMSGRYLEQFKKELLTEAQERDGVLIDVRYNGGGRIAHNLLEILQKKPFAYTEKRGTPLVPDDQLIDYIYTKPSICLVNQGSASNSEMFADGFRELGIGKIVGVPTAGAVIATTSWRLMDGGSLRVPQWGVYTVEGQNMERLGVQPDYLVPYDPNAAAAGLDPQLDKAVEVLLAEMDSEPGKWNPPEYQR